MLVIVFFDEFPFFSCFTIVFSKFSSSFIAFILCLELLKRMLNGSFQVSMMERDSYLGRILTGRIFSGIVHVGDKIHGLRNTDSGTVKIEEGKVCHLELLDCSLKYH